MIKNKIGFLIIIEGLDGTGKSLHSKLLQNKFIEAGYKVFCTREPGGTPVGEEIRKILKSDVPMSISTQAYLFASSRNQNNIKILEMINDGYIVISDRHFLSSYVYQGELSVDINEPAMRLLDNVKKQIILFDCCFDTHIKRMHTRDLDDRYEHLLEDKDQYNSLRGRYISLAEKYDSIIFNTDNIETKDIDKENQKLFEKILQNIKEEI